MCSSAAATASQTSAADAAGAAGGGRGCGRDLWWDPCLVLLPAAPLRVVPGPLGLVHVHAAGVAGGGLDGVLGHLEVVLGGLEVVDVVEPAVPLGRDVGGAVVLDVGVDHPALAGCGVSGTRG